MYISKRLLLMVPALLLAVVTVGILAYSPTVGARPAVIWTPKSLYQALDAGESLTTTVTFTPTQHANDVQVRVVPQIAPYVSVSPSEFASITGGEDYELAVTFTAPANAIIGLYGGTIQLRQGQKTLALPLPVDVDIPFPYRMAIDIPSGWYAIATADAVVVSNVLERSPLNEETLQTESFFRIRRREDVNPDMLPVTQWVDEYFAQGGSSEVLQRYPLTVNGREAQGVEVSELGGRRAHIYIVDGPHIFEVSYGLFAPHFISDYEAMLHSIAFTE